MLLHYDSLVKPTQPHLSAACERLKPSRQLELTSRITSRGSSVSASTTVRQRTESVLVLTASRIVAPRMLISAILYIVVSGSIPIKTGDTHGQICNCLVGRICTQPSSRQATTPLGQFNTTQGLSHRTKRISTRIKIPLSPAADVTELAQKFLALRFRRGRFSRL